MDSTSTPSDPISVSDLTIGELIKRLRPAELYAIVATLAGVLSAAFAGGWYAKSYVGNNSPPPAVETITATRENNPYQVEIRRRPPVQAFERFLRAAESERWPDAFALTSEEWRSRNGTPRAEDLAKVYRMTHSHNIRYYIPRDITEDKEEYDVDFEFSDFIPRLPIREGLAASRIGDVLQPKQVESLARELLSELPRNYKTTGKSQAELGTYIKRFAADQTFRDIAVRDDLIDLLGGHDHLNLEPIIVKETFQGKVPPTSKRRFVKVTMVKNAGEWKVQSYNSFMVEKR